MATRSTATLVTATGTGAASGGVATITFQVATAGKVWYETVAVGKVVFCEDDAIIQRLIRAALRGTAHEVLTAADGEEGLALIRRIRPDVVFTDVSMPKMTGFELAAAMKADPELRAIPLVFMTASVQRAEVERALAAGATGVLAKPFSASELRARVAEHLR